ncbi:unnamed protein product, partial [Mesorhabditis spiculigera]
MRTVVLLCLVSAVAAIALVPKVQKAKPNVFGIFCDVCIQLVKVVEQDVTDDEAVIQKKLDDECDKLFKQGIIDTSCKQIVDYYVKDVIDMLKNGTNAQGVCQSIDFC